MSRYSGGHCVGLKAITGLPSTSRREIELSDIRHGRL